MAAAMTRKKIRMQSIDIVVFDGTVGIQPQCCTLAPQSLLLTASLLTRMPNTWQAEA